MIDWEIIDNNTFEKIAYEYISSTYPNLKWIPTKATRDGNKDGVAICEHPMEVTIKYWYEAKYSKSVNKSIPKSHLDSTLVSCLLDGKVVVIAFITNAYISDDYRRRADIFSKQRDNLKIIYINGTEIEEWFVVNPHIEKKYFNKNTAESQNLASHIIDYCILEQYSLNGEIFSKVNNLELDREYVLYVSFYSVSVQTLTIQSLNSSIILINPGNKLYDDSQNLKANIGYNNFFISIKVVNQFSKEISLSMKTNEQSFSIILTDVSILNIYNPVIVHKSQTELKNSLFSLLQLYDISNAILFIVGNAGVGKSYLLNSIYNDNKNPFSSYVVSFCGDDKQDVIICFKIIILAKYGDIWNFAEESDDFNDMEQSLILQIRNCQLIGNCVEDTINFFKNNKEILSIKKSSIHIFVDDFHKLSLKNQQLMNSFFQWFIKQEYNCKIIVFSRPESDISVYTKKYNIGNIVPEDVKATIKQNFGGYVSLPQIVSQYPLPLNVLHFITILSEIHYNQQIMVNKNELEMSILLNRIYEKSISLTHATFGYKMLQKYKDELLVYCVYKIKTGITIESFKYFNDAKLFDNLYQLMQKRIVKELNDNVLPYHDILVSAFDSYNNEKLNCELEKFIVYAENNNYITKAKLFSVLMGMGNRYFWKYRLEAEKYRDDLHKKAAYYEALEIADNIEKANTKSLNDYSAKDCWNLFVKANCLKYTVSHQHANAEFEKISNVYNFSRSKDIQGIYLEAETEMVNDHIWMLEIISAQEKLQTIEPLLLELYKQEGLIDNNFIHAFLNYYNRRMFIKYMIDTGTEDDYNLSLFYSSELGRKDYEAFANIDYAKCLYIEDIKKAKIYMKKGLEMLNDLYEPRRQLDVESELWFINSLIKGHVLEHEYLALLKRANLNHYTHTSTKIRLKWIFLNVLFSKIPCSELREQLYRVATDNTSVTLGKRNQVYLNHLLAALYYKEHNFKKSIKYSLKCIEYVTEMGNSYKKIHEYNAQLKYFNGFELLHNTYCEEGIIQTDNFILDTRLW